MTPTEQALALETAAHLLCAAANTIKMDAANAKHDTRIKPWLLTMDAQALIESAYAFIDPSAEHVFVTCDGEVK